ncbi:MAG: amylo-alpha-1,6-glucosidase [Candidatus Marinimicrobia bacterium]|nr:amylo-alpha-1,6-glucosidase [Candidatus Neomarinimicrobiota bacterium]
MKACIKQPWTRLKYGYPFLMSWVKDHQRIFYFPLILLLMACSSDSTATLPSMHLEPGSQREIAYTDKQDVFWVTRVGGYNNSPWHGLNASKRNYFEDLFIYADDELLPREAAVVTVDPVKLVREYPRLGIHETWTLLDEQRTLVVQLEADRATQWHIQPAIQGGSQPDDFQITATKQVMDIEIKRLANTPSSYPYLKLWFSKPMRWEAARSPEIPLYNAFLTQSAQSSATQQLVITFSLSEQEQNSNPQPEWIEKAENHRQNRISNRLDKTRLNSDLQELNTAITWAHASLDALVMNQMGKGIYAGLPWFDDYWGRDVFISFTGAVLVSGQYEAARQILLTFADLQNVDESDPNYGRIPNRAQPEDIIYNTTDGTPWFVRSVWNYYRYTGDEEFLKQVWPAIRRATKGALKNWTDDLGRLRHADADTWMDARGPDGPWSPRGDRAIDIQFIWRDQLEITKRLAVKFGDGGLQKEAQETLARLVRGLEQYRSEKGGYLVDHLNADGSPDEQIRPNVFLVSPLFHETCDWVSFKTLAPRLVTSKGVLSLSQEDANFHPYHHLPGRYVQDAAYHNGIIWTWNSAATITQAIHFHQYHYAQALFDDLTDQILNRGAVGTIAELTDAWPREGQYQLSGTFSQAWSVAEYLRSFYQDILGVQPDLSRSQMRIAPRLPNGMNEVSFTVPLGPDLWEFEYENTETGFEVVIRRTLDQPIDLSFELLVNNNMPTLEFVWDQRDIHLRYEKQMGQWTVPGDYPDYQAMNKALEHPLNSLAFSVLDTSREIPVLKGPEHRLLNESEVIFQNGTFKTLHNMIDASGDDRGESGHYAYPSNPQFAAGIVDILEMQVGENQKDYLFEMKFTNLTDPGWHPEYGYQLTYCAIGISYEKNSGTSEVGKNSQASFKTGFKADQILYISGGILLVDDEHQPVAEYMPLSSSGAIGDAQTGKIHFMLPRDIFSSDLTGAQFQVAVGCQDDHGGAGMGDFRAVQELVAEWAGGGKIDPEASNVYDWLIASNNDR